MKELLFDIFNQIYLRVYGSEYTFINKKVLKCVDEFLKKIPEGAGEEWLMDYMIFQFSWYSTMKMRFERVYATWIFGPAALQRWNERTEEQSYFAGKYKANLGIKKEFEKIEMNEYEETERGRFDDMSRQLIHCNDLSLFWEKAETCKECELFEICKIS